MHNALDEGKRLVCDPKNYETTASSKKLYGGKLSN